LVAGVLGGSYLEFQVHQNTDTPEQAIEAITPELPFETIEPLPPVLEKLQPPPPPPPLPPAPEEAEDVSGEPTFTPFTVAPSILNRQEVIEAMAREYPPLLRNAGIGGTIRVYFFIEADGTVGSVQIDQSSGHEGLDAAALSVAEVYQFSPALNRDEAVPVWVSFPITFQVNRSG
jgi:TonB family protein